MFVLSEDTIWLAMSEALTGGVFRTTNGGVNWEQQFSAGVNNPNHIYMYNGRLGFIGKDNVYLRRTSDGGANWTVITGTGGFLDMYFVDSLTGWKTSMQKTTDGGLTWINQVLPSGGSISSFSSMKNFSNVNADTIWGGGGYLNYSGGRNRGFLYHTTNGGIIWRFQLPDTSFGIPEYDFVNFTNKLTGWGYESFFSQQINGIITTGVHTVTGGNDTFYTSLKPINSNIPEEFNLEQNYPNPFNPITKIRYMIQRLADLKLIIFDVTGKQITVLADKKFNAGTYEVTFDGSNYSSGVYFYSLFVDGKLIDTKKMVLIK